MKRHAEIDLEIAMFLCAHAQNATCRCAKNYGCVLAQIHGTPSPAPTRFASSPGREMRNVSYPSEKLLAGAPFDVRCETAVLHHTLVSKKTAAM